MTGLEIIALIAGALKAAADVGPIVFKTAQDATPFIMRLVAGVIGRELDPNEQAHIEAQLDALSAQLQVPLPPADEEDI